MSASFAPEGRTVTVRLSQVDKELRKQVADKLARDEGLSGVAYFELMIVAEEGRPDAELDVDEAKARRVLVERKQPLGPRVRFG